MRHKAMVALGVILGAYIVLCVLARLWYPRVLFPAPRVDQVPPELAASMIELAQDDGGGATRALYFPAPPGGRTAVVFHGNGETIFDDVTIAEILMSRGLGVMLVEYRGYGITYGPPPSEESLYADGEAAMKHLAREGVPNERVAIWGTSLGTAIASEMARRGHGARLALVSPFTSATDLGRRAAPFLPASLVMTHRLDTHARAKDIAQPVLVAHGDADEIVPFEMGEAVAKALPNARFMRVEGAHHNDVLRPEVLQAIATHLTGGAP
jgi:uncharacterized protein